MILRVFESHSKENGEIGFSRLFESDEFRIPSKKVTIETWRNYQQWVCDSDNGNAILLHSQHMFLSEEEFKNRKGVCSFWIISYKDSKSQDRFVLFDNLAYIINDKGKTVESFRP